MKMIFFLNPKICFAYVWAGDKLKKNVNNLFFSCWKTIFHLNMYLGVLERQIKFHVVGVINFVLLKPLWGGGGLDKIGGRGINYLTIKIQQYYEPVVSWQWVLTISLLRSARTAAIDGPLDFPPACPLIRSSWLSLLVCKSCCIEAFIACNLPCSFQWALPACNRHFKLLGRGGRPCKEVIFVK